MDVNGVSLTAEGLKSYPLHSHNFWEIMCYREGEGYLATLDKNIPFKKGTVIVIPPGIMHGSVSENGFSNIVIHGDFDNLFMLEQPAFFEDNEFNEAEKLSYLILKNRYNRWEYFSALCTAYVYFILKNIKRNSEMDNTISRIISRINLSFTEADFDVTPLLKHSGYAEDYIREKFKSTTGLTPVQFLTKVRIKHACNLLDIYKGSISISDVARNCGFEDMVYFSKRFKHFVGVSPSAYRRRRAVKSSQEQNQID